MQPNNPYQPEPTGIDYLNQIAQPPQPTGVDKKTRILIIVAAIVGVLSLAFIFIASTLHSQTGPSPLTLAARLQKLSVLSNEYGDKLRTTSLQDANSSLKTILITANQSIAGPLADYSIDPTKQSQAIASLDPSAELSRVFDDAHLNAVLDVTYAREMNYQLEDTLVMMRRLHDSTKVSSMKQFLEKTIADFENLQKRFSEATQV